MIVNKTRADVLVKYVVQCTTNNHGDRALLNKDNYVKVRVSVE